MIEEGSARLARPLPLNAYASILSKLLGRPSISSAVQFSNADSEICFKPPPSETLLSLVHPLNALVPSEVTDGSLTVVRAVQPAKAELPTLVALLSSAVASILQFSKQFAPTLLTEARLICESNVHPLNALAPSVTEASSLKVTSTSDVQLLNALEPIDVAIGIFTV